MYRAYTYTCTCTCIGWPVVVCVWQSVMHVHVHVSNVHSTVCKYKPCLPHIHSGVVRLPSTGPVMQVRLQWSQCYWTTELMCAQWMKWVVVNLMQCTIYTCTIHVRMSVVCMCGILSCTYLCIVYHKYTTQRVSIYRPCLPHTHSGVRLPCTMAVVQVRLQLFSNS